MKENFGAFFLIIAIAFFSLCIYYSILVFHDKRHNTVSTKEPPNKISQVLQMGYNISENESILYSTMFAKYSDKYNIDWKIYPAIISVESDWDPAALSDSGAVGVMQIMEPTFKDYCDKLKIPYREHKTIHNDVLNLTVGLEYISQAVKKRGLEKGVKSYIGGHGFSDSNKQCKDYYIQFLAEYSKVKTLSEKIIKEKP